MRTCFPVFATLLTILGVAVLCGLGAWQLQRLEWKTEILNKLETEYAKDPHIVLKATDLDENFDYKRGTLRGIYNYSKQVSIGPRIYDGQPGFHILTPLKLGDGSYVLVNRGWVPQDWVAEKKTTQSVSVTGLLRKPQDHNPFTPDNHPEKDEWYSADTAAIAAAKNLPKTSPYIFYLENSGGPMEYPYATATKPELANNHLQYALFWFTMAGILCVIYALRFLRTDKSHD